MGLTFISAMPMVGILCNARMLSDEMNFSKNMVTRFNMKDIGELNGENISATFNEVLS
jgi:hypothetical protein